MTERLTELTIPTKDGKAFSAYLAAPSRRPAPTVIVIQEIFGVNAELKTKCAALADQGFLAVAPDLFWRIKPGVDLTDGSEAEWAQAMVYYRQFDVDKGVMDLRAVLHTMRGHAWCSGKVGAVGYCLGGKLAYLMAARSSIDSAVSYYGVGLEDLLSEAEAIRHPLVLHIAGQDEYVPPEAQRAIKAALEKNPAVTLYEYPHAKHAFSRWNGQNYDAHATKDAHARTLAFLARTLGLAHPG